MSTYSAQVALCDFVTAGFALALSSENQLCMNEHLPGAEPHARFIRTVAVQSTVVPKLHKAFRLLGSITAYSRHICSVVVNLAVEKKNGNIITYQTIDL